MSLLHHLEETKKRMRLYVKAVVKRFRKIETVFEKSKRIYTDFLKFNMQDKIESLQVY